MFASFTSQLFSGLVEESPALVILPDVAESWKITDGGRTYVFRLRADARWSDGVPVTAGDFEFALETWHWPRRPMGRSRA